ARLPDRGQGAGIGGQKAEGRAQKRRRRHSGLSPVRLLALSSSSPAPCPLRLRSHSAVGRSTPPSPVRVLRSAFCALSSALCVPHRPLASTGGSARDGAPPQVVEFGG